MRISRSPYRRSPTPYTALGLLVMIVAAAWAFGPAQAPADQASTSEPDCEATLDPATIEQGTVHEEVRVSFSENIGEVDDVSVDPEADLDIIWLHEDQDDPTEARVRVSAVRAEVGDWDVTFHGELGNCHGRISVVEDR